MMTKEEDRQEKHRQYVLAYKRWEYAARHRSGDIDPEVDAAWEHYVEARHAYKPRSPSVYFSRNSAFDNAIERILMSAEA